MTPPQLVAHADWSIRSGKRRAVHAILQAGRYLLSAPQPVPEPMGWLRQLHRAAAPGALLVGLDFPIGLPLAYAQKAGVTDFLALLPQLGTRDWQDFFRVAARKEEIEVRRPFYPQRPGGTRQQHLLDGLGVNQIDALRRRCDLPQPHRRAAAALFWTMGAQQVGKAAISGWQELLQPARQDPGLDVALWPFSGTLTELLQPGRVILAEAYPAEFYHHLGIDLRGRSKRRQADRQAHAAVLLSWTRRQGVVLEPALRRAIVGGFGPGAGGEDAFDAVLGAMGMLNVVLGKRPLAEPTDAEIRRVEGWIFGQAMIPETV